MKFEDLDISKIIIDKTIQQGFTDLTPIQEQCIPEIIKSKDVVGQAETGSGKTIAFCIPILEKIKSKQGIQTVVLTPTRELCLQVSDVFKTYGTKLGIKTTSIYGGVNINPQIKNLKTTEVVVATPGRMLDHIRRGTINLSTVRFLILDETDKMLEMGFIDDVEEIIRHTPKDRQTLMFSATIMRSFQQLMKRHLRNPVVIKTQSKVDKGKLHQIFYDIYEKNDKFSLLVHLLKNETKGLAIVFCATRVESDFVAKNLRKQGINASAIHGGMTQNQRTESLNGLKKEHTEVLVATDVAARGLDIKNVSHIYNYDVPKTPTEYIHRIGRTARAGENGVAVTLLTRPDHDNFRRVQSDDELIIKGTEIPEFKKVEFQRRVANNNRKKNTGYRKRSTGYRKKPTANSSNSTGYRKKPTANRNNSTGYRKKSTGYRKKSSDSQKKFYHKKRR
jgi:ATP-dependent RNA helicase DeaD